MAPSSLTSFDDSDDLSLDLELNPDLSNLEAELNRVSKRKISVTGQSDSTYLTEFTNDIEKELKKGFKSVKRSLNQGDLLGGILKTAALPANAIAGAIGSAIKAPFKVAAGSLKTVAVGALEPLGRALTDEISKGISNQIKAKIGDNLIDSQVVGELIGSTIASNFLGVQRSAAKNFTTLRNELQAFSEGKRTSDQIAATVQELLSIPDALKALPLIGGAFEDIDLLLKTGLNLAGLPDRIKGLRNNVEAIAKAGEAFNSAVSAEDKSLVTSANRAARRGQVKQTQAQAQPELLRENQNQLRQFVRRREQLVKDQSALNKQIETIYSKLGEIGPELEQSAQEFKSLEADVAAFQQGLKTIQDLPDFVQQGISEFDGTIEDFLKQVLETGRSDIEVLQSRVNELTQVLSLTQQARDVNQVEIGKGKADRLKFSAVQFGVEGDFNNADDANTRRFSELTKVANQVKGLINSLAAQMQAAVDAGDATNASLLSNRIITLNKQLAGLSLELEEARSVGSRLGKQKIPDQLKKTVKEIKEILGLEVDLSSLEVIKSDAFIDDFSTAANALFSETANAVILRTDLFDKIATGLELSDRELATLREELIHSVQVMQGGVEGLFDITTDEILDLANELERYKQIGVSQATIRIEAQAKALKRRIVKQAEIDAQFNRIQEGAGISGKAQIAKVSDRSNLIATKAGELALKGVDVTTVQQSIQKVYAALNEQVELLAQNTVRQLTAAEKKSVVDLQSVIDSELKSAVNFVTDAKPATVTEKAAEVGAEVASAALVKVGEVGVQAAKATINLTGQLYKAAEALEKLAFSVIPFGNIARPLAKTALQATVLPGAIIGGATAFNPAIGGALSLGADAISGALAPVAGLVTAKMTAGAEAFVSNNLPAIFKSGLLAPAGEGLKALVSGSIHEGAEIGLGLLRRVIGQDIAVDLPIFGAIAGARQLSKPKALKSAEPFNPQPIKEREPVFVELANRAEDVAKSAPSKVKNFVSGVTQAVKKTNNVIDIAAEAVIDIEPPTEVIQQIQASTSVDPWQEGQGVSVSIGQFDDSLRQIIKSRIASIQDGRKALLNAVRADDLQAAKAIAQRVRSDSTKGLNQLADFGVKNELSPKLRQAVNGYRSVFNSLITQADRVIEATSANDLGDLLEINPDHIFDGVKKLADQIQQFIESDLGKDLVVNTTALGASIAAGSAGPLASAAADIGTALVTRVALEAAIATKQAGLTGTRQRVQEALSNKFIQKKVGKNLTGDIVGFGIGNATNLATGITGSGAIASIATVGKIVEAIEKLRAESALIEGDLADLSPDIDPTELEETIRLLEQYKQELEEALKLQNKLNAEFNRQATEIADRELANRIPDAVEVDEIDTKAQNLELSIQEQRLERIAQLKNQFIISGRKDLDILKQIKAIESEQANEQALAKRPANRLTVAQEIQNRFKNINQQGGQVDTNLSPEESAESAQRTIAKSRRIAQRTDDIIRDTADSVDATGADSTDIRSTVSKTEPKINGAKIRDSIKESISNGVLQGFAQTRVGRIADAVIPVSAQQSIRDRLANFIGGAFDTVIGGIDGDKLSNQITSGIKTFKAKAGLFALALAGTIVAIKVSERAKEAIQRQFNFEASISGLSREGRQGVRETAKELSRFGVDRQTVAAKQGQFADIARGQGLPEDFFAKAIPDFLKAASTQGLSADQAERGLTTLGQVLDKGKLYAEEVQQLNEAIPGSRGLIGKSLGVRPDQLEATIQGGGVDVNQFAKRFTQNFAGRQRDIDFTQNPEIADKRFGQAIDKLAIQTGGVLVTALTRAKNLFADIVDTAGPLVGILTAAAQAATILAAVQLAKVGVNLLVATGAATALGNGLKLAIAQTPKILALAAATALVGSAFSFFEGGEQAPLLKKLDAAIDKTRQLAKERERLSKIKDPDAVGAALGQTGKSLGAGDIFGSILNANAANTLDKLRAQGKKVTRGQQANFDENGQEITQQFLGLPGIDKLAIGLTTDQIQNRRSADRGLELLKTLDQSGNLGQAAGIIDRARGGKIAGADQKRAEELTEQLREQLSALEEIPAAVRAEVPELNAGIKQLQTAIGILSGEKTEKSLQDAITEFTTAIRRGASAVGLASSKAELQTAQTGKVRALGEVESAEIQLKIAAPELQKQADRQSRLAELQQQKLATSTLAAGSEGRLKLEEDIAKLQVDSIENLTKIASLESQIAEAKRRQILAGQEAGDQRKAQTIGFNKDLAGAVLEQEAAKRPNAPQAIQGVIQTRIDQADINRRRADVQRRIQQNEENLSDGTINQTEFRQKELTLIAEKQGLVNEEVLNEVKYRTSLIRVEQELKQLAADKLRAEQDLRKETIATTEAIDQRVADLEGKRIEIKFDVKNAINKVQELTNQTKLAGLDSFKSIAEDLSKVTVKSFKAINAQLKQLGVGARDRYDITQPRRFNRRDGQPRSELNQAKTEANFLYRIEKERIAIQVKGFQLKEQALALELAKQQELLAIEEKKARLANQQALDTALLDKEIAQQSESVARRTGDERGIVQAQGDQAKADLKIKQALSERSALDEEFTLKRKANAVQGLTSAAQLAGEGQALSGQISEGLVKLSDKLVVAKPGRAADSQFSGDYDFSRLNKLLEQSKKFDLSLPNQGAILPSLPSQRAYGQVQLAGETKARTLTTGDINVYVEGGSNPARTGNEIGIKILETLRSYDRGLKSGS